MMKYADKILMSLCSGECLPELSKYEGDVRDAVYLFLANQYDRWAGGKSIGVLELMLEPFFAAIQKMALAGGDNSAAAEKEGNHEV